MYPVAVVPRLVPATMEYAPSTDIPPELAWVRLDFKNVPKRVKFSQTPKNRTPYMSEPLNMFTKGTRAEVTPELDWMTKVMRRPARKKTRWIM